MNTADARIIAKHLSTNHALTIEDFQQASGLSIQRARWWITKLLQEGSIVLDAKQIENNRIRTQRGRPRNYWKWIGA